MRCSCSASLCLRSCRPLPLRRVMQQALNMNRSLMRQPGTGAISSASPCRTLQLLPSRGSTLGNLILAGFLSHTCLHNPAVWR